MYTGRKLLLIINLTFNYDLFELFGMNGTFNYDLFEELDLRALLQFPIQKEN